MNQCDRGENKIVPSATAKREKKNKQKKTGKGGSKEGREQGKNNGEEEKKQSKTHYHEEKAQNYRLPF